MKGRIILRPNGLPVSPRTILTMTTLFVSATAEEAVHLPQDKQIIVTGVGLVAAATAVMEAAITTRPDRIVNLGTAGALADGHSGVYEITHVVQHDFAGTGMDDDFAQKEFELVTSGELPTARLASGDHFVSSTEERHRIVQLAELVDMEASPLRGSVTASASPSRSSSRFPIRPMRQQPPNGQALWNRAQFS